MFNVLDKYEIYTQYMPPRSGEYSAEGVRKGLRKQFMANLVFLEQSVTFVQRCGPSSHVILWSICPFLIQVDDGKGGCFDNPYWRFEFHKEEGEHSDGMNAWWMLIHASLIVQEPFMNSRIRWMLYFLHRGSNAEAGRKTAEGFSGRIHCFRGKCEDFLKTVI